MKLLALLLVFTGVTNGAGTAYLSGAAVFTPFVARLVLRNLYFSLLCCILSTIVYDLVFGHCIACHCIACSLGIAAITHSLYSSFFHEITHGTYPWPFVTQIVRNS